MTVLLKRAYAAVSRQDGYRVLVDKLWPRGVSKEEAKLDDWLKDIAPSDDLRTGLHDGKLGWGEFRRCYLSELKSHKERVRDLAVYSQQHNVTLVYAAKDEQHNNAVVLKQYLAMLT